MKPEIGLRRAVRRIPRSPRPLDTILVLTSAAPHTTSGHCAPGRHAASARELRRRSTTSRAPRYCPLPHRRPIADAFDLPPRCRPFRWLSKRNRAFVCRPAEIRSGDFTTASREGAPPNTSGRRIERSRPPRFSRARRSVEVISPRSRLRARWRPSTVRRSKPIANCRNAAITAS